MGPGTRSRVGLRPTRHLSPRLLLSASAYRPSADMHLLSVLGAIGPGATGSVPQIQPFPIRGARARLPAPTNIPENGTFWPLFGIFLATLSKPAGSKIPNPKLLNFAFFCAPGRGERPPHCDFAKIAILHIFIFHHCICSSPSSSGG